MKAFDQLDCLCEQIQQDYLDGQCGVDQPLLTHLVELGNHAEMIRDLIGAAKALDETLKAFDHCNEVYVPQLKLSALVREKAEAILEKFK